PVVAEAAGDFLHAPAARSKPSSTTVKKRGTGLLYEGACQLPTPNAQLPTNCQLPTPKGSWRLGVGSWLGVGCWVLGVDTPLTTSVDVQLTDLGGLGACQKRFVEHARAVRRGQLAGIAIDVREGDAVRRLEADALMAGKRADHEGRPDGKRRLRSAEPERLVVVEAHPDDGEELG